MRLKLMSGKWRFPRANRGMMGLMAMVGLTAGAWAMDFLGGGRMGSWWRLSSSDGLEQDWVISVCGYGCKLVNIVGVGDAVLDIGVEKQDYDGLRFALDEKDVKIRELTAELQRERKRSAAFQEQLDMVLRDMEDHSHHLSRNIDDIVQSVREIESKRLALSHS
nr:hypothetical protein CFP56_29424 [Quercus suber]